MKGSSPTRGFTLIELLVVILILALLAAIGIPTVTKALGNARTAEAAQDALGLQTAVKSYFNDYGYLPIPADDHDRADKTYDDDELYDIILALMGDEDSSIANEKGIRYLEVNTKRLDEEEEVYADPWGRSYELTLDTDYDGSIEVDVRGANKTFTMAAIVRCTGPRESEESDDIIIH